jgi:ATP-dependent Clp protease ATP-binding subunit ClpB
MGSELIRENYSKIDENTPDNKTAEIVDQTKAEVIELLKQHIRPEFLNRIDETIMFTPLSRSNIAEVVNLQVKSIQKMLDQSSGIKLDVQADALAWLAEMGYDPEFGARPVKRLIHRAMLNQLSKAIIGQTVDRERAVIVSTNPNVDKSDIEHKLMFKN